MPGHNAIVFRSSPRSPGGMGEIALDPSPTGRSRGVAPGLAPQDFQIAQQAEELALAGSVEEAMALLKTAFADVSVGPVEPERSLLNASWFRVPYDRGQSMCVSALPPVVVAIRVTHCASAPRVASSSADR
jgi:hypothetical protein